jgi:hypothetical protein
MSLTVGMVGLQRPQGEPDLKPEDLEEDNKMIFTHYVNICRNGGTAAAAGGAWPQA